MITITLRRYFEHVGSPRDLIIAAEELAAAAEMLEDQDEDMDLMFVMDDHDPRIEEVTDPHRTLPANAIPPRQILPEDPLWSNVDWTPIVLKK